MARKRHVERKDPRRDDLAPEASDRDRVLEARAKRLHDAACEFPWETSSPDHREAWLRKAKAA